MILKRKKELQEKNTGNTENKDVTTRHETVQKKKQEYKR
jgi:hypothetical protein